ncbi:HTH_48 domain-containing protein [Trichonephila clavipes]|nr:HTH_48 domain-containing protein [Trichonephila clavipes]
MGSVEDDEHAEHPRSTITEQNIAKVNNVIWGDRGLNDHTVKEFLNLDCGAVRRNLTEELHTRKICAEVVPKVLSEDQKQCRKDVRVNILERIANELNMLESVVTCNETWSFTYDPEKKT